MHRKDSEAIRSEPQVRIRRADEREAPALSALAVESKWRWNYAERDIERWRADLRISADEIRMRPTFVAEVDEALVGFYSLVPGPGAWGLEHLWVAPQSNGKGIGRAMLAHACAVARDGGASALAIDADPNAEPFYLACGAIRRGAISAPTADDPRRTRPQLELPIRVSA